MYFLLLLKINLLRKLLEDYELNSIKNRNFDEAETASKRIEELKE